MHAAIQPLARGWHLLKDLVWGGTPCRCEHWIVVNHVPADPTLATSLPWRKPCRWQWAHHEVTEALIREWSLSPFCTGPDTHVAVLALSSAKARRLLDRALADGSLALAA